MFDLAFENVISVAAVAHPSLLKVPDDLEVRLNYLRASTRCSLMTEICRRFQSSSANQRLR